MQSAADLSPQRRDPEGLCPCIRAKWETLRRGGQDLVLIETLRQADRQAHYIATGVSWTSKSKHLAQPPNGLSLAFDTCPRSYLAMKGWNPSGELWRCAGEAGEALGLTWGGRWKQRDLAHFQLEACLCPKGGA